MDALSKPGEKNFSLPLSDLGEPDKDFTDWWYRGWGLPRIRHPPGFAKWTVQQGGGASLSQYEIHDWYSIEGQEAEVHFTGKTLDGTVFASSTELGTPLTLMLTQDDVMKGFGLAVGSMQAGEKAVFTIPAEFAVTESGRPARIPWNIPPNQALRLDIELVSLITDILDDQGILKKIVKFGSGCKQPRDFDEVFVNYNACLEDGTSISKLDGVEFSIAEGFFCPAFAHVVASMTKGEEAVLIIKPQYGFGDRGRPSNGTEAAVPPDATLYVNIQLISWKPVSHIGEEEDILKKTLRKANGWKRPRNQAIVKVRLIGKLEDGTVFDKRGHDGEEPFEFTIDEEHVIEGLDEAVLTMMEGEVASFTIPPQHAFHDAESNRYQLAVVPPSNSIVTYEVELLTVVNEKFASDMTPRERIESARRKEKEGDDLFNSGKYLRAYRRYYKASQIIGYRTLFRRIDGKIKEMLIQLAFKIAECAIQLQFFREASDCFREVLHYDPGNVKAKQMVAQSFPKASIRRNSRAMDLRFQEESRATGMAPRRLKHGHKRSGRMVAVPPVTNASQPVSLIGRSPATQPATPAFTAVAPRQPEETPVGAMAPRRLKHGHKNRRRMVAVPPVANASQAVSLIGSPATQPVPATPAVHSGNPTTAGESQSMSSSKRLLSCFGCYSSIS